MIAKDSSTIGHAPSRRARIAGLILVSLLFALVGNAVDLLSVPGATFSSPASAGGDSYVSAISGDGRYVLFTSTANNLAHRSNGAPYLLPRPGKMNAFVHDRVAGTTMLISVDANNTASGLDDSNPTTISTNGQFVLFESAARNLVAGETIRTNNSEIYLRDLVNGTTTLVSVRYRPVSTSGATGSTMTPDARFIAFSSADSNIVAADTNFVFDVFVRDMSQGVTRLASVGFTNLTSSFNPVITPDGKFVAFAGTTFANFTQDVYVCDMTLTNVVCVSTNSHQYLSGGVPTCYGQEISQDGKYVAYQANASAFSPTTAFIFRHNLETGNEDLVSSNAFPAPATQPFDMTPDGRFIAFIGKTNNGTGIFLWDAQNGTTTFVSADTNGLAVSGVTCDSPTIDTLGRIISFVSTGGNLVTNSAGSFVSHIYRRDMQSGVTELVDAGMDGSATNRSINSDFYMSADGKAIVFDSPDADLVDQDGNGASDVFVRDFDSETTELASAADASLLTQTSGLGDRRSSVRVSADGHFAVFIARGEGLVPGQTNRFRQVFVRDLVNQSNVVVSVDTNGLDNADGSATECAISGDGRYVAFTSLADNLVPNDTNHVADVFLRDLQTGKTILASTNGSGGGSASGASTLPKISGDGRYVMYISYATNIIHLPGPIVVQNLFVYDQVLRTNYILTTTGVSAFDATPDGRYLVFYDGIPTHLGSANVYVWDSQLKQRIFTNSVANPVQNIAISTNGQWIAYVFGSPFSATLKMIDRLSNSNITVGAGAFGMRPNPRLSGDGRNLVYSTSTSFSSMDTNLARDVYVFDVLTKSNILVSRSFVTGNAPNGNSDSPDISADGRFITYESDAADIVPQDSNGRQKDIFLYDRLFGSTMLLSASIYGAGTGDYVSQSPAFTADGQTAAFQSWASDLTPNDFNQGSDLFLFKILSALDSTNPPPVLTGQVLFSAGSGAGTGQTLPQITWAAAPGSGYQVQYKTNLTDDVWLPVNGSVVIQNGVGYVNDLAPDPEHRFYRIVGY